MRAWAWLVVTDPVTVVTALVLLAAAAGGARPLARWRGWPAWATFGLLVSVAAVAVLTLLPAPGHPATGPDLGALRGCARSLTSWDLLWTYGLLSTDDRGERVGNVAMFVPLTFFAVRVTGRPVLVALAGAVVPVAVEFGQVLIGAGRTCVGYDWVNNALGALLGVLLAVLVGRFLWSRPRGPDGREQR